MSFKHSNLVKLSTRNLQLKDRKLQPRWVGPFRILQRIGSQAYQLALPEKYARLHNVFPIQAIEIFNPRDNEPLMPLPNLEEDNKWEVEEVKDKANIENITYYLVKWGEWPTKYNQWIPKEDMSNAQIAIRCYKKKRKRKDRD